MFTTRNSSIFIFLTRGPPPSLSKAFVYTKVLLHSLLKWFSPPCFISFALNPSQRGEKTHSPPALEYKPVTSCSPFRGLPLDQEQSLAVLRHLLRAVISFLQPRSYFSPLFCESCDSLYEAVTVSSFSNMKETYRNPPSSYIGLLAYFFKESISYCAKNQ